MKQIFNKSLSYNFDGGNHFSDSGLLLVRSFVEKLGLRPILDDELNDSAARVHSNASIIEQLIYTTAVVKAYNKRGIMENFINEAKIDFSNELLDPFADE